MATARRAWVDASLREYREVGHALDVLGSGSCRTATGLPAYRPLTSSGQKTLNTCPRNRSHITIASVPRPRYKIFEDEDDDEEEDEIFSEKRGFRGVSRALAGKDFSGPEERGNRGRIVTFLPSDCHISLLKSGLVANESLGTRTGFYQLRSGD